VIFAIIVYNAMVVPEGGKAVRKVTLGKLAGYPLRELQERAVNFIEQSFNDGYQIVIVNAPTGVGKTVIGVESLASEPFYYLCLSKDLQDQIERDYEGVIPVIKGRNNYRCPFLGTADACDYSSPSNNCYIDASIDCEYLLFKNRALKEPYTCMNFSYFLNFSMSPSFPRRNLIIDEGDAFEAVLTNHISLVINVERLDKSFGIGKPKTKTKVTDGIEYLRKIPVPVRSAIARLKETLESQTRFIRGGYVPKEVVELQKRVKKMELLLSKVSDIIYILENEIARLERNPNAKPRWIYYYDGEKLQVKPIWLTRDLVDQYLLNKADKILFISATMPPARIFERLYSLNIDPKVEVAYLDLPSPFDKKNRKVLYSPRFNMTFKNMPPEKKIVKEIEDILDKHQGQRGVIHCVSYKLANTLKQVKSDRLIFHTNKDKDEAIDLFKLRDDAVLVSPSSTRGLDLKDDLCRFIIFLKCPYLNVSDKLVSARLYSKGGRIWYLYKTIEDVIQGCGRGCRHPKDWVVTYLLDEQFGKVIKQKMLPKWFIESLEYDF